MAYYPGRHGSISSGELEEAIARNTNFASVRRSGRDDGNAGLVCTVTGKYLGGIGGGRIPEWSYMRDAAPRLVRGWRNILYEFVHRRSVRPGREIRKLLGDSVIRDVLDYGMGGQPMFTPEPTKVYIDGDRASGLSGI